MNAPLTHLQLIQLSWAAAEQRAYSACEHCDHHRWQAAELRCACPALTGAAQPQPQPVALLRRQHGGCGPEAVHMSAPWLPQACAA